MGVMYDRYIPAEGWYSVDTEPAWGERASHNRSDGLLGSLFQQFGLGGNSPEPSRPLFPGIPLLERLDSGDILLLLVLYYLYQESKDEEWLILLALVVLMG